MQPAPPPPRKKSRPSSSINLPSNNPLITNVVVKPEQLPPAAPPAPPASSFSTIRAEKNWKAARKHMLSSDVIEHYENRANEGERTREQVQGEIKVAQRRLTTSTQSGKLLGHQRTKIRRNFLVFALILTIVVVTILAGFGTLASTEAQLQTAGLLGTSLLRSVQSDLLGMTFFSEREVVQFAINFPDAQSSSINVTLTTGMSVMYAQLDSSTTGIGIQSELNDDDKRTTKEEPASPLWQMYFATDSGLVVGVSRALPLKDDPTNTSTFQCWGGTDGINVRRTSSSISRCKASDLQLDDTREYKYDARQRPWYELAKKHPGQFVWTKPYTFSATGYVGLTVALYTKLGVQHRDKQTEGVFGIDITLNDLESFLSNLARSSFTQSFGSFPAELVLIRNETNTESKDKKYSVVVGSSKEGQKMVSNTILNSTNSQHHPTSNPFELEIVKIPAVTGPSVSWFVFTKKVRIGGIGSGWDGIMIGLIRRSNFLGSLELTSRTLYPFIAAVIVIIIIPTTELVTRAILKVTKQHVHHDKDKNKNMEVSLSMSTMSEFIKVSGRQCSSATKTGIYLHLHFILPVTVSIVMSFVCHSLLTIRRPMGLQVFLPILLVLSKVGLAYLLHKSWIHTATFHMGTRYNQETTSKLVILILSCWIVACACSAGFVYGGGIPEIRVLQAVVELIMFCSLAWLIKGDHHTPRDTVIIAKRNVTPIRVVYAIVLILGFTFTCFEAFRIVTYGGKMSTTAMITTIGPVYLIPSVLSVLLLSIAAKCDKPIRQNWPRPHLTIYVCILATILVWIVPFIIKTIAAFWTSLTVDDGFIVNLVWSFCVIILNIFTEYFVGPAAMPASGVGIFYGFCLFRSFMSTLLFLKVKPLDVGFYVLVLLQCFFKIGLGLGIKNTIWDRYCSRELWKSDPETHCVKMMERSIKVNLSIVAPICTKMCMIVIILAEYFAMNSENERSNEDSGRRTGIDGEAWHPPFTGSLHQLERLSMAAGFFVQISFELVSNEVIESVLSYKISKFKRKLSTIAALGLGSLHTGFSTQRNKASISHSGRTMDTTSSMRRSSMSEGGLGSHLMLGQVGKKWKWERHRSEFFISNWKMFTCWTAYLICECVCFAIEAKRVDEIREIAG